MISTSINKITRLWWIPLLTGLVGIALGVWCLCSPQTSLPIFAYIFCGLLIAAGIFNLIYAALNSSVGTNWGWSMALGILEVICGVWMFTLPEPVLTASFIFVVGIWILVAAINALCEACTMAVFSGSWLVWMLILLISTIVFAFIFMAGPIGGGIAVWLWIGISFITFGLYRVMLAFQIQSVNRSMRDRF